MNIRSLDHHNVCILGYGLEGRATLQALRKYAPHATITIADSNPNLAGEAGVPLITGPHYLEKLAGFDFIIKSPGIPWHPEAKLQAKLTSATELFMNSVPRDVQIIGITGTKGKSTTTNLIYQVLKAAGRRVFIAGNIGEPMLRLLSEATAGTIFVLELSSYQLETLRTSPSIAVVTSFFPDHLDYHGGLKNYHEAKKNIARFQTLDDIIFYNPAYPACREIAQLSPGRHIAFHPQDFPGSNPVLTGAGNQSNLAAAYHVGRHLGVPEHLVVDTLAHATGLPHRQEPVGEYHGIQWVDDSAATTPESTVAALDAFGDRIDTIIVGGLDRGYDFTVLGQKLAAASVRNIILFPETGTKIRAAIEAAQPGHPKTYFETSDMTEAVAFARQHTTPGKTALLSSGSPSYNLFKNYPDRGRAFRTAVTS